MNTINAPGARPGDGRGLLVDHLRSFITLLVVAHHAVLAYHPYAPELGKTFDAAPMMWRAFPVLDTVKWTGIDLLVTFNDTFFMMLMFLVVVLLWAPWSGAGDTAGTSPQTQPAQLQPVSPQGIQIVPSAPQNPGSADGR